MMRKYILYFAILIFPLRNIVEKVPNIDGIQGLGFMNVMFLVLLLLAFSIQTPKNTKVGYPDYISTPLTLYLIYFLFLVFIPINSYAGTWTRFVFWKDMVIGFSMYFIILKFQLSKKEILIALAVMIVANLYMDSYFWRWVRWMNFASFTDRLKTVNGTFGKMCGPNPWAAFFSTYSFLLFTVASVVKNKKLKLFLMSLFAGNVVVMLFSFSRGAYVAFTLALVWLLMKQKKIFYLILLSVIVISYNTVLPVAVVDRINMTETTEGNLDSDAESRLVMWEYALDGIEKKPVFGNGLLSFRFLYPGTEVIFNNPHNHHLHMLYEGGIIGYFFFIWLLIASYRQSMLLVKSAESSFSKAFGMGSAACVISLFVVNFFGNRWSYICLIGYFWIIMALNTRLLQIEYMENDIDSFDVVKNI